MNPEQRQRCQDTVAADKHLSECSSSLLFVNLTSNDAFSSTRPFVCIGVMYAIARHGFLSRGYT